MCPLRTGKQDHRGSFGFNVRTGWYGCFKCGIKGRLRGYDGEDFEVAPEEQGEPQMGPPDDFTELADDKSFVLRPARDYLRGRGLGRKIWRETRIGACLEGRFAHRVVVPILSPDGVWLGYVGRSWKDAMVKYLYPKGMNRREVLYNHAAVIQQTERPLFVVEGVFDALALWPDAVAVLGKPSDPQIFALADAPRPVAVCLDGDAWAEGQQLAMRLKLEGQRAGNIHLPPKKDPDEVPRAWLDEEAARCLG